MHAFGTGVPRCFGVASSASIAKAALALGCSITPGLRNSFGRVTCMARAAPVPGYGHWVFYCCVALVFGSGFRGNPANPGWGLGWVCFGSGFGCAPPLLAAVLGCVCVCLPTPFVPCHSWLGCAVWVCVLGPRLRLRPATAGCGVWVCACLCARSACTTPLLAEACGVGVCS